MPEEDRATDIGNMRKKFDKDRACDLGDILADRQTHADRYILITILSNKVKRINKDYTKRTTGTGDSLWSSPLSPRPCWSMIGW